MDTALRRWRRLQLQFPFLKDMPPQKAMYENVEVFGNRPPQPVPQLPLPFARPKPKDVPLFYRELVAGGLDKPTIKSEASRMASVMARSAGTPASLRRGLLADVLREKAQPKKISFTPRKLREAPGKREYPALRQLSGKVETSGPLLVPRGVTGFDPEEQRSTIDQFASDQHQAIVGQELADTIRSQTALRLAKRAQAEEAEKRAKAAEVEKILGPGETPEKPFYGFDVPPESILTKTVRQTKEGPLTKADLRVRKFLGKAEKYGDESTQQVSDIYGASTPPEKLMLLASMRDALAAGAMHEGPFPKKEKLGSQKGISGEREKNRVARLAKAGLSPEELQAAGLSTTDLANAGLLDPDVAPIDMTDEEEVGVVKEEKDPEELRTPAEPLSYEQAEREYPVPPQFDFKPRVKPAKVPIPLVKKNIVSSGSRIASSIARKDASDEWPQPSPTALKERIAKLEKGLKLATIKSFRSPVGKEDKRLGRLGTKSTPSDATLIKERVKRIRSLLDRREKASAAIPAQRPGSYRNTIPSPGEVAAAVVQGVPKGEGRKAVAMKLGLPSETEELKKPGVVKRTTYDEQRRPNISYELPSKRKKK